MNDVEEADEEAYQGKPSTGGLNNMEEELQGNKKPTQGNKGDQEEDQGILLNEEQNKTDKQVYGNRILDDEKEVQTNIMQVEESTNAKQRIKKLINVKHKLKYRLIMLKKRLKEKIKNQESSQ